MTNQSHDDEDIVGQPPGSRLAAIVAEIVRRHFWVVLLSVLIVMLGGLRPERRDTLTAAALAECVALALSSIAVYVFVPNTRSPASSNRIRLPSDSTHFQDHSAHPPGSRTHLPGSRTHLPGSRTHTSPRKNHTTEGEHHDHSTAPDSHGITPSVLLSLNRSIVLLAVHLLVALVYAGSYFVEFAPAGGAMP